MAYKLDSNLERARRVGDYKYIQRVTDLRLALYSYFQQYDWVNYNEIAHELNKYGAEIPDHKVLPEFPKENTQMGMFDTPMYLTGKEDAFVQAGETFWLHNARTNGMVNIGGTMKEQVKLLVSHNREDKPVVVFSAGAAIVRQVNSMDQGDRARLPMEVRLDQIPSKQGSPTNVITPADQPPPEGSSGAANGSDDF